MSLFDPQKEEAILEENQVLFDSISMASKFSVFGLPVSFRSSRMFGDGYYEAVVLVKDACGSLVTRKPIPRDFKMDAGRTLVLMKRMVIELAEYSVSTTSTVRGTALVAFLDSLKREEPNE